MAKKNPNIFLYQINFNKEKYPEVCDRLEEMKEAPGGIAWYLRKLIAQDIQAERGNYSPSLMESSLPILREQKQSAVTITETPESPEEAATVQENEQSNDDKKEETKQNLSQTGGFEI